MIQNTARGGKETKKSNDTRNYKGQRDGVQLSEEGG
jgi:hypothetical protein